MRAIGSPTTSSRIDHTWAGDSSARYGRSAVIASYRSERAMTRAPRATRLVGHGREHAIAVESFVVRHGERREAREGT